MKSDIFIVFRINRDVMLTPNSKLAFVFVGTDLEEDCIKRAAARPGCEFRVHDLVLDAPFDEFDLIACRNVLIYFSKILQEKVLNKFYNSLKPGGLLWLGNSESLRGEVQKKFEMVDVGAKIYRRR